LSTLSADISLAIVYQSEYILELILVQCYCSRVSDSLLLLNEHPNCSVVHNEIVGIDPLKMCIIMREGEREREKEGGSEGEREGGREI
jgi:hypothetical protein